MPKLKTFTKDSAAALIRKEGMRFAKYAKNVEKKKWISKMFPNESKTGKWRGKNGSYLRTKVNNNTGQITKTFSENWTAKAHAKFQEMYPKGKWIKKTKKTKKTRSHETPAAPAAPAAPPASASAAAAATELKMPNLFWTRISPKNAAALAHFEYFKLEINDSSKGHWDGDKDNKAIVGDTFAFVVGPADSAYLKFYTIVRIGDSSERLSHWSTSQKYQTRKVVILQPVTGNSTKTYNFKQFVSRVYKSNNYSRYFPNQTQRVTRPLPKDIILEEYKTAKKVSADMDKLILELKNKQ